MREEGFEPTRALSHRISQLVLSIASSSCKTRHLNPAPWTRLGYSRILKEIKEKFYLKLPIYAALILSCFRLRFRSRILFFRVRHLHCLYFFQCLELRFMFKITFFSFKKLFEYTVPTNSHRLLIKTTYAPAGI